jgi:hypothetical protein
MASGGRRSTTWEKGKATGAGRKPGAKDDVPRSFKASLKAVYEQVLTEDPDLIKNAVVRGLMARKPKEAFPYVRIFAELGHELKQQVEITGSLQVENELADDIRRQLDQLAATYAAGSVKPADVAK